MLSLGSNYGIVEDVCPCIEGHLFHTTAGAHHDRMLMIFICFGDGMQRGNTGPLRKRQHVGAKSGQQDGQGGGGGGNAGVRMWTTL